MTIRNFSSKLDEDRSVTRSVDNDAPGGLRCIAGKLRAGGTRQGRHKASSN